MSLKDVNDFFNTNEDKLNKLSLGRKYHSILSIIGGFIVLYILFRDSALVMQLPWKIAVILGYVSLSICINIFLMKYFSHKYKQWYESESKALINNTLLQTWQSQKYDTLRFVLNKFPLKTIYLMFITQGGINWNKDELKYKNLDITIEFLKNNPCDFKDLDSSEYTYKYIAAVMPELTEHVDF